MWFLLGTGLERGQVMKGFSCAGGEEGGFCLVMPQCRLKSVCNRVKDGGRHS